MSAPIQITAQVLGAESVSARFLSGQDRVRNATRDEVRRLGLELLTRVKQDKLTGQVLKVRTGRLRRSINEKFIQEGDRFESRVGTNLAYARFWEKGFNGTENIRAHMRRVRLALNKDGSFMTQHQRSGVYGPGTASMSRLLVFAKKGARHSIQGQFMVSAHTRRVNQPARPFLVPSLDEMRDTIKARLLSAMGRVV